MLKLYFPNQITREIVSKKILDTDGSLYVGNLALFWLY
jgi:hypothetical protein